MADGIRETLKPANENPWYVLATIYGEQAGKEIDWNLHRRNRRIWNGWACEHLSISEREDLAKRLGIDPKELAELTDEEKAEVQTLFSSRLPGSLIPEPHNTVIVYGTYFPKKAVWERCFFASAVYFTFADFDDDVNFSFTVFSDEAEFKAANFYSYANFAGAKFSRSVGFSSEFLGNTDFSLTEFSGYVDFKNVLFSGCTDLISATFCDSVSFRSSTFCGHTDFSSSSFLGRAYFVGARFTSTREYQQSYADFSGAVFEGSTTFRDVQFADTYPDFSGAVLPKSVTFSSVNTVRDERSYNLSRAWPDPAEVNQNQVATARASCATIRHAVAQQGLPEEEHFFFRKEMAFAARDGDLLTRLPYILFGWISDFGYSIARPTIGLLILWAIGFAAFWGYFFSQTGGGFFQSLSLSFSNLFPFFGFRGLYFGDVIERLPSVLRFLSALQTIGGFICLFFLGLGLRTRFRLR
jgi:hypothetical protein